MLKSLHIMNLAIAKNIDIDFTKGMNGITGETGAGKSILLDGLGLTLGNKASVSLIGNNGDKAIITSIFEIENNQKMIHWLKDNGFENEENINECFLKRIIDKKGKSKSFINSIPCNLKELKYLGQHLIEIHGQHEHHRLLKKEYQLELIDTYGSLIEQKNKVKEIDNAIKKLTKNIDNEKKQFKENSDKRQLLEFQVTELETLNPNTEEFKTIEEKYEFLNNLEFVQENTNFALQLINNETENNVIENLKKSIYSIEKIKDKSKKIENILPQLNSALIEIEDAHNQLENFLFGIDIDEEEAVNTTSRYQEYNKVSKKHNTTPEKLETLFNKLSSELNALENPQDAITQKENLLKKMQKEHLKENETLYKERILIANKISPLVNKALEKLGFKKDTFSIILSNHSLDNDYFKGFYIAPNVGQEAQPLNEIASGGELSRISLAIQVILSKKTNSQTIIYDEVDVGIGGETANVVGNMLQSLSESIQIICITHLPQVACFVNHHLKVEKEHNEKETITKIIHLNEKENKKQEIARMLYGENYSKEDLKRIDTMLKSSTK